MRVRRSTRHGRPPPTLVSTGSTTRRCAGLDRFAIRPGLRVIELVEITARESVKLVDERTRLADTPAVGPRITLPVRRSTRQAQPPRHRGLDRLDHPAPWSRQARPPGTVVSTGSTTRHRGLDRLDHPAPWSRQARHPRLRGLDRLDHPRLRGLDRSSVRPALRVIELVEITARASVELVDERTRSPDTPAVGPRITIRVRRSTRRAQPPRTRGLDRLDHPDPWSRQARPAEVARARPVLDATGPSGDRACRDHCARVRRARR